MSLKENYRIIEKATCGSKTYCLAMALTLSLETDLYVVWTEPYTDTDDEEIGYNNLSEAYEDYFSRFIRNLPGNLKFPMVYQLIIEDFENNILPELGDPISLNVILDIVGDMENTSVLSLESSYTLTDETDFIDRASKIGEKHYKSMLAKMRRDINKLLQNEFSEFFTNTNNKIE